jgi:hypothetical protein
MLGVQWQVAHTNFSSSVGSFIYSDEKIRVSWTLLQHYYNIITTLPIVIAFFNKKEISVQLRQG